MVSMTSLTSGPMTAADVDAMPDDGYRRELIDGVLIVTPGPSYEHQDVVGQLHLLLSAACPRDLKILLAPYDILLDEHNKLQPDLLVARRDAYTSRNLPTAPLLAIEVLSPSTRRFDLHTKRSRYESAGTASYWVVDPITLTLTAWEMDGEEYVEVAHVSGDEAFAATQPFDVTITPSGLRD